MRAHAGADERDLRDAVVVAQVLELDLALDLLQRGERLMAVGLRAGERDVGAARGRRRDVLHDHVEVDAGVGERTEDPRGHARLVRDTDHGDLGVAHVVRDSGDDRLLHVVPFGC